MPWTIGDVPRFKKGLTFDQKKKWVSVANGSLASCQKRGGSNCDSVAIKTANGVTESMKTNANTTENIPLIESSTIVDFLQAEISEAHESEGKKQLIVTLLKEGPGNQLHNNFYKKSALESAMRSLQERRKQYFNHAENIDNPSRDIRDWASSISEMWIVESSGKAKLVARTDVYDPWLWDRAKAAPKELAVSIEGKGKGRIEEIDGKTFNAIYDITSANGVNWVDYPGNAGMGVKVMESTNNNQEDQMNILEMAKTLTVEDLRSISEQRKDLKEFFLFGPPEQDEATKKQIGELRESIAAIKKQGEDQSAKFSEQIKTLESEKAALSNRVEAHELRQKEIGKEKLMSKLLSESKLGDPHKTDTFKSVLLSVKEYKNGDAVVTEEDQMKSLIKDRESICVSELAHPNQPGSGSGDISEEEQGRQFSLNVFGIDTKPKEDVVKKKEVVNA